MNALCKTIARVLGALLIASAGMPTHALVISGSFEGVADGVNPGGRFSFPYRGTFSIDTEAAVDPTGSSVGPNEAIWLLLGDGLTLDVQALPAGLPFTQEEPRWLRVANFDDRQEVSLSTGVFFGGGITLVSAPGGLIDGLDFRSFHVGPIDVAASHFSYTGHQETGGGPFTAFRFDTPAAPVPEPHIAGLLAVGLGAWMLRRPRPLSVGRARP